MLRQGSVDNIATKGVDAYVKYVGGDGNKVAAGGVAFSITDAFADGVLRSGSARYREIIATVLARRSPVTALGYLRR